MDASLSVETTPFDRDYYERGPETGKSLYSNYRWLPEATIPMAGAIIDACHIARGESVLDVGCAKGYLVKALRWLGRDAWGYDPSEYAISQADPEIARYVHTEPPPRVFDVAIAKDVLEHLEPADLKIFLHTVLAKRLFVVVPLGQDGRYYAPDNELDPTHIIREPLGWWASQLHTAKWRVLFGRNQIEGIKDRWVKQYPYAHGFLYAERQ